MLQCSIYVAQQLDAITVRNWTMGLRAYGEQYERWINVGETATDFLSYLIALVSTSIEDSFEPIHQENEPPVTVSPRDWAKTLLQGGVDSDPPSDLHVSLLWPVVGLWHLRTRRLDETMQMARSDMQHWRRRLMQSWLAALTVGNSAATPSESSSTDKQ